MTANFLNFYFEFIFVSNIQFRDSFDSDKQGKWQLHYRELRR